MTRPEIYGIKNLSRIPALTPQGVSLPFTFDLDGDDVTGWICTINVMRFPGDTPAITRVITPTANTWTGYLTATETAALTPTGQWRLVGNLTNASTDQADEVVQRFSLQEAY